MKSVTVITLLSVAVLCTGRASAAPATRPAAVSTVEQKSRELLASWKNRLAEEHFTAVVAGPFVIAGDGGPARIAQYRDQTILAAARALHTQFFRAEPSEPVLILLFESEGPYKRLAKKWFDDDDVPHYGFYRHRDRTMLMNVGTGTGTLVHELTHALIAPDFPNVPDWFNEGLASLYEQCSLGHDTITGHENWRLPALQKAIQSGKLRPLSELAADDDFRNAERVGLNYAEARYLMFYLQEKGQLQRFYAEFRAHAKEDPTGLASLKRVIAPQSLEDFEKDWRKWVLGLRFG
jgi:Protein of unknown function (DUF1570)